MPSKTLSVPVSTLSVPVSTRAAGKGFSTPDGYVAAIATARGFTVAKRDVAPFQPTRLNVINPWGAKQ